jgi:hypothetical protein
MAEKLLPKSLRAIAQTPGHIRVRKAISDPTDAWNVELFDGADRLDAFEIPGAA